VVSSYSGHSLPHPSKQEQHDALIGKKYKNSIRLPACESNIWGIEVEEQEGGEPKKGMKFLISENK
jgi:hypothetical protein